MFKIDINHVKSLYSLIFFGVIVIVSASFIIIAQNDLYEVLEKQQDRKILYMLSQVSPETRFYSINGDVYTLYDDKWIKIGYAFLTTTKGYNSDIKILVGLKSSNTISGIYVVSHMESKGYAGGALKFCFFCQTVY